MRSAQLLEVVLGRLSKRPLRLLSTSAGVAIALMAFTFARHLADAGAGQLDETISRTQGKPATLVVEIDGVTPAASPTLSMIQNITNDLVGEPTTIYYSRDDLACPGADQPISTGTLQGPLLPLTGIASPTRDDNRALTAVALGEATPEPVCLPERLLPAITQTIPAGPWERLGLDHRTLLWTDNASAPAIRIRNTATQVTILAVTPANSADTSQTQLDGQIKTLLEVTNNTTLSVTTRRLDTAGDFQDTQALLSTVLTIIGTLGLAAGVTGVITTQLAALPLKLRFYGMCRSLGATANDITTMAFLEGAAVILVGATLGVTTSTLALATLGGTLETALGVPIDATNLTPPLQALLTCIPAIAIAGAIPAIRARKDSMNAARSL